MTPEKYAEIKVRHDAWIAEKNRKPWSPTDPQALRAINNNFTYALDDLSEVIQRLDELEAKVQSYDEDRAAWDQTAEKMESLMRGLVKSRDEAQAEVARIRAAEAAASTLLAELSATPAEQRVSALEIKLATVRTERDLSRAEVERLRSALRLLWEEATDEVRCDHDNGHELSQPCWETVTAALKEGDR